MEREQKKKNVLQRFFRNEATTEDLFFNNEVQANLMVAMMMLILMILVAGTWVLSITSFFDIGRHGKSIVLAGFAELTFGYVLCTVKKGTGVYLKYFLQAIILLHVLRIDFFLSYNVVLLLAVPIILSCRYFSVKFTAQISVATIVGAGITTFFSARSTESMLDLNMLPISKGTSVTVETDLYDALEKVPFSRGEYTHYRMVAGYLPKFFILSLIAIACMRIAARGRKIVMDQAQLAGKNARMESDLTLASKIQNHMLPSTFPAFPDHEEFDLYAMMVPAKEVAGDFYDFYMLDETHIATVIGDVSGKGVPSALFMATAKTLIRDLALIGLSPAEIFTRVNKTLCEGNASDYFLTAWMGILDLKTGRLTFSNAGHNPPYLYDGVRYCLLEMEPETVLGIFDDIRYDQYEVNLYPGDKLFLYTDGVTEATNVKGRFFGQERVDKVLNVFANDTCENLLGHFKEKIDVFVGNAERSDDITMLSLEYVKPYTETNQRIFPASKKHLPELIQFLEEELNKEEVEEDIRKQILVSAEEIYVNISDYGFPNRDGEVALTVRNDDGVFTMRFMDGGIPFNPLLQKTPNLDNPIEEREEGGLGIFMVRNMMDSVTYSYENSMNVLTVQKKIAEKKVAARTISEEEPEEVLEVDMEELDALMEDFEDPV